jgi:hypothetical protein
MNKSITVVALFAAAVYAQAAEDDKSAKTAPAPQALTIPKDAVKEASGTYSYTDKQGKKWIYRDTPFGVTKTIAPEPGADTRPNPNRAAVPTTVIDKGDTVRFERPSPFGKMVWEKRKSDLTDEERKMVDAQSQSQNQGQSKTQSDTPSAQPDAK